MSSSEYAFKQLRQVVGAEFSDVRKIWKDRVAGQFESTFLGRIDGDLGDLASTARSLDQAFEAIEQEIEAVFNELR